LPSVGSPVSNVTLSVMPSDFSVRSRRVMYVLSEQAPDLPQALARAMAEGVPYVILDGKVFETDRCSEPVTSVKGEQIDAWYSGKARRHGGNVQAVLRAGPV
jgi:hypothetical protein